MQSNASSVISTSTITRIKRLGSYLVEAGLITQAHIDVALADQEATGVRFGDILVIRGWLTEQTIEYLMEKIILPEREAAARESLADPEMQQLPSKSSPIAKQKFYGRIREDSFWRG